MHKPQKERAHGSKRRYSQNPIAASMSGRPRELPTGHATLAHFYGTLCRHLPQSGPSSACRDLCLWPAIRRGTQNVASIAERLGQERRPLQRFMGWADWAAPPLRQALMHQVAPHLGHERSEEHTSELQSQSNLVCRLLL